MTAPKFANEVGIEIDGRLFRAWESVGIARLLDGYSTITLTAPFEADRAEMRETFRPFSYKPFRATIGGEEAFTGTLIDVSFGTDASRRMATVGAYSKAAVFTDTTMPGELLPWEFNKVPLNIIAGAVGVPFDVGVEVLADVGAPFKRAALEPGDKIQQFLSTLAQQRGLVLSDNPAGDLRIWKSVATGNPVARLTDLIQPITSIQPSFNPQDYFSEITGFAPVVPGRRAKGAGQQRDGGRITVKNPWLSSPRRALTFKIDDTEIGDARAAVEAKLGRMFGNAASWTIGPIPTWRDPHGELWTPNTTILLRAPDAAIYTETEFLIRGVTLSQSADSETAELTVVLPGAFDGSVPDSLPWMG